MQVVIQPLPESFPFPSAVFQLDGQNDTIRLGRKIDGNYPAERQLVFRSKVVSRTHALLTLKDGEIFLKDIVSHIYYCLL